MFIAKFLAIPFLLILVEVMFLENLILLLFQKTFDNDFLNFLFFIKDLHFLISNGIILIIPKSMKGGISYDETRMYDDV